MPDIDFQKIELNLIPKKGDEPVIFYASQYETARPFIADLFWGDSEFAPGDDCWAEIDIRKNDDNLVVITDDVAIDNNEVSVVLPIQAVTCIGKNLGQVKIYAADDQLIAALNFILEVQPDPLASGVDSETAIDNLTQQIEDIATEVIGEDYYNKTEVDTLLADKADVSDLPDMTNYYTKTQTDTLLNGKADASTTYTKTEVDNALALKANSSDLATVATTGDYDDLINKPTIPAAQIQSDYAQADNTQVDYIKNKPDINAMIAAAIFDILPVATEGPAATCTFDTEIAAPLQSVIVDVVATGGYDADTQTAHPIVGYSSANITRCGVNLWDEQWELGLYSSSDGTTFPSNQYIRSKSTNYIRVSPFTQYYIYGVKTIRIFEYDSNYQYIKYTDRLNNVLTLSDNCRYIRFCVYDSSYGTTYNHDVSINYPSTDTTYHAYNGSTVTIAFGQTVYGGVLDVTRGKLTVTHVLKKVSDISWTYRAISGVTGYIFLSNDITGIKAGQSPTMASSYAIKTNRNYIDGDGQVAISNNTTALDIVVKDDTYTSADDFVQNRGNESFVFELATPFDIDLTPEQISAIVGTNNVSSDTGDTTVNYKDTIQHYIDNQ